MRRHQVPALAGTPQTWPACHDVPCSGLPATLPSNWHRRHRRYWLRRRHCCHLLVPAPSQGTQSIAIVAIDRLSVQAPPRALQTCIPRHALSVRYRRLSLPRCCPRVLRQQGGGPSACCRRLVAAVVAAARPSAAEAPPLQATAAQPQHWAAHPLHNDKRLLAAESGRLLLIAVRALHSDDD